MDGKDVIYAETNAQGYVSLTFASSNVAYWQYNTNSSTYGTGYTSYANGNSTTSVYVYSPNYGSYNNGSYAAANSTYGVAQIGGNSTNNAATVGSLIW